MTTNLDQELEQFQKALKKCIQNSTTFSKKFKKFKKKFSLPKKTMIPNQECGETMQRLMELITMQATLNAQASEQINLVAQGMTLLARITLKHKQALEELIKAKGDD